MKIAVLADIHANYIALQTIASHVDAWRPDYVIVAGDVVNRGSRPRECLQFILEKQLLNNWRLIRGNHEDYVIEQALPDSPRIGPVAEVHRASIWTYDQLNKDVEPLVKMPFKQDICDPSGRLVRFVHGSLIGNRDGIYPETSDHELTSKIHGSQPQIYNRLVVFCTGHTHRPLIRSLNGVLVVNAGSVGLPFDGNTKAGYAQLVYRNFQWKGKIIRLDYDFNRTKEDFYSSGYLEYGGPLIELVLVELITARSHLYNWSRKYQLDALNGRITMRKSIDNYITEMNTPAIL